LGPWPERIAHLKVGYDWDDGGGIMPRKHPHKKMDARLWRASSQVDQLPRLNPEPGNIDRCPAGFSGA